MEEKVTIRLIAEKAGVSIGSVHCALAGKSGVSEETRARILRIAGQYGYEPNPAAASLKRKKRCIAVDVPQPLGEARYYYRAVWSGIKDYFRTARGMNLELLSVEHMEGEKPDEAWERILREEEIHAVLTAGYTDRRGKASLDGPVKRKLPIFLLGNDVNGYEKECCVQPDYHTVGRVMAQLMSLAGGEGSILVYGGGIGIPSHYEIVEGVDAYLREKQIERPVWKLNAGQGQEADYRNLVRILETTPELSACCSVNARGSILLAEALKETGRAGKIAAIGCELFEESKELLRQGVLTAVLDSNPYVQAYVLCRYLCDFLTSGIKPPKEKIFVRSEIITAEALAFYDSSEGRILL